jgi:drug/metabolite transporter (DMT)-like permease
MHTVHISVGSSSLFGGILLIFMALYRRLFETIDSSGNYIWLTISLIFLGVFMLITANKGARLIENEQALLINNICRDNKSK